MPGGKRERPAGRIGVADAARMIGVGTRTIERWVDAGKLRGGRPRYADGSPIPGSHRWVEEQHAREVAEATSRLTAEGEPALVA